MKKFGLFAVTAAMCGAMAVSFAACGGAKKPSGELYDKAVGYESKQITEEQWEAAKAFFTSKGDLDYSIDYYSFSDIKADLLHPKKLSTRYQEEATVQYVCNQQNLTSRIDYEKRTDKLTYTGKYAEYMNLTVSASNIPKSGTEATAERYAYGPAGIDGYRDVYLQANGGWQVVERQVNESIVPNPLDTDLKFSNLSFTAEDKGYYYSFVSHSVTYKFDENGKLAAVVEKSTIAHSGGMYQDSGTKWEVFLINYDVEPVSLPTVS